MMVLKIFLVLYFSIRISTDAKMPMDAMIRNGITPFLTRKMLKTSALKRSLLKLCYLQFDDVYWLIREKTVKN